MKFFCDLFTGLGGEHWDLARVLGAWGVLSYSGVFIGALIKGQTLDFSALGVGYAAVMVGAAGLIFAKDQARTNAVNAASAS